MTDKVIENNQVTIMGKIVSGFLYSHEIYGEGFYMVDVEVERLSDSTDIIPVMISERLLDVSQDYIGACISVNGQFRSYNRHEEKKNKLVLSVFAREIEFIDEIDENAKSNQIFLDGFICKELYAPFVLEKDFDYIKDLNNKFTIVQRQAENAGADGESIEIIKKYKKKIIESIRTYYKADISKSNTIIYNLLKDIGNDSFAVSELNSSYAFRHNSSGELQFFRCRLGNPSKAYKAKEMLFLPKEMRAKSGNYRFSIPGNPSMYLANSSYGCWIETGFPYEADFNVSPIVLDGTQKVFNLAVTIRDFNRVINCSL